ncbi:MAG: hypothetical protein Q8R36_01690 [bacterium]|nr:hypothetical protein [bacterium]
MQNANKVWGIVVVWASVGGLSYLFHSINTFNGLGATFLVIMGFLLTIFILDE